MSTIGHNSGNVSPFDEAAQAVDLVWLEARNWLDGAVAETQAEADAIGTLLDMARKAKAKAAAALADAVRPHLDAEKAERERFKPIIAKCDTITASAKEALAPFLAAQEAAKRAAEAEARKAADEARRAAQEAFREAQGVEAKARAEELAEEAKRAEIAAAVAAKAKAHAKGGARAIAYRKRTVPEIYDLNALMKWLWTHDRSALAGFAETYVAGAYRAGQRDMDGVRPVEERTVA